MSDVRMGEDESAVPQATAACPTQLPTAQGACNAPLPLPTIPGIRFDECGLVPVVVQEAESSAVLLLAYMNADALEATLRTGRAHFWSRSRGKLWRKGEQSGRAQIVAGLYVNCEANSLLLKVHQQGGAACHTGYPTCYYRRLASDGSWQEVEERVFDPADVYEWPLSESTLER